MIDQFHEEAERTGAKIVLAAGIDSVPSDLGTQFAIEQLERRRKRAAHVKALFMDYAGSFSGGTKKTLEALEQLPKSGGYDAAFCSDPYVLGPRESSSARPSQAGTGGGLIAISEHSAAPSSWRRSTRASYDARWH